MRTGLYIGRFQPFHDGHKKMIKQILKESDRCWVLVRDMKKDDNNPYSASTIKKSIHDWAGGLPVGVMIIPGDDLTVYYGRKVGWDFKEIRLDKETEAISATKIRQSKCDHEGDDTLCGWCGHDARKE